MTPTVEDPFRGHFTKADPRGPLTAAGGCVWPTVPAYRYALQSDDATGRFLFLRHNPILLEIDMGTSTHDMGRWNAIGSHPQVAFATATKLYYFPAAVYFWLFTIQLSYGSVDPTLFFVTRSIETCNRDIPLPKINAPEPDSGDTGETFWMRQVEHDKTTPPT